jgi:hypothetical protein
MKDDQRIFLSLLEKPPLRLTVEQMGWMLNCTDQDVRILVAAKLIKPLGNPAPNAQKYFATFEILELTNNRSWLEKATSAIYRHWLNKNRRRVGNYEPYLPANGNLLRPAA